MLTSSDSITLTPQALYSLMILGWLDGLSSLPVASNRDGFLMCVGRACSRRVHKLPALHALRFFVVIILLYLSEVLIKE